MLRPFPLHPAAPQAALADQSRSEEQRRQLKEAAKRQLADMAALQEEVAAEAQEREALAAKIAAMESKVLHGGVNLLDKVGAAGGVLMGCGACGGGAGWLGAVWRAKLAA
jgi:hypothetical protein